MTRIEAIAQGILEVEAGSSTTSEIDKLLLRIFEVPALMGRLDRIGNKDGKLELDFISLPQEGINLALKAIGPTKVEILKFMKNGQEHVGLRVDLQDFADQDAAALQNQSRTALSAGTSAAS